MLPLQGRPRWFLGLVTKDQSVEHNLKAGAVPLSGLGRIPHISTDDADPGGCRSPSENAVRAREEARMTWRAPALSARAPLQF